MHLRYSYNYNGWNSRILRDAGNFVDVKNPAVFLMWEIQEMYVFVGARLTKRLNQHFWRRKKIDIKGP